MAMRLPELRSSDKLDEEQPNPDMLMVDSEPETRNVQYLF